MAFASVLLASCATSDSDVPFGFAASDIAPQTAEQTTAALSSTGAEGAVIQTAAAETAAAFVVEEGDPILPDSVASAPALRPGSEGEATAAAPASPVANIETASVQPAAEAQASTDQAAAAVQPEQAAETPVQVAALVPEQPKKRGFLSAFFSPATPAAQPKAPRPLIDPTAAKPAAASAASPAQPLVQLAATGEPARPLIAQQPAGDANPLPGVRQDSLFEISRRSGLDDDSDIDLHEGDEPPYQLASAAGLARLAPNGLLKQTDHVDVACLKPSLVRVLKTVERHYGRKVVVTSGYRSPDRNRRARGARNSLHMYCAAADVQVEGVSKWDLAQFVRSMPGRGGVGTYCHTDSVHIDVGPERDWNWRCRRRK